jgi:hypothetical protein
MLFRVVAVHSAARQKTVYRQHSRNQKAQQANPNKTLKFPSPFYPHGKENDTNAGISDIKLYLTHTAKPKARPRSVAFRSSDVSLSKILLRIRRSKTNNGTVIESGPSVAAWMIRTGRNTRNKQKAE